MGTHRRDHGTKRPQKITLAEMRASGVRGLLIYCADYKCSHWIRISADHWSDDVRLSDLEYKFTCTACGTCGADVRPEATHARKSKPPPVLADGGKCMWMKNGRAVLRPMAPQGPCF